jgi:hypothetical protein
MKRLADVANIRQDEKMPVFRQDAVMTSYSKMSDIVGRTRLECTFSKRED